MGSMGALGAGRMLEALIAARFLLWILADAFFDRNLPFRIATLCASS